MIDKNDKEYAAALLRATEGPDGMWLRKDGVVVLGGMSTGTIFASTELDLIKAVMLDVAELAGYDTIRMEVIRTGFSGQSTVWHVCYPSTADVSADIAEWRAWMEGGGGPVGTWNMKGWGVVPCNNDGEGVAKVGQLWDPRDADTWCDDDDYSEE